MLLTPLDLWPRTGLVQSFFLGFSFVELQKPAAEQQPLCRSNESTNPHSQHAPGKAGPIRPPPTIHRPTSSVSLTCSCLSGTCGWCMCPLTPAGSNPASWPDNLGRPCDLDDAFDRERTGSRVVRGGGRTPTETGLRGIHSFGHAAFSSDCSDDDARRTPRSLAAVSGRLNFPEGKSWRGIIRDSDRGNRACALRQSSISTLLDLS